MLGCVCGIVIDPIIRRVRGPMGLPGSTSIVTRFPGHCLKYAPAPAPAPVASVSNMHQHAPTMPSKEYLCAGAPQRNPQNVQYFVLHLHHTSMDISLSSFVILPILKSVCRLGACLGILQSYSTLFVASTSAITEKTQHENFQLLRNVTHCLEMLAC